MKIQGNPSIQQTLRSLAPRTLQETPANDPEMQQHIDRLREMAKEEAAYQKRLEAEHIAKKIARGEHVSEQERQTLSAQDASWLAKAEQANMERQRIRAQLAKATDKVAERAIVLEGKMLAGELLKRGEDLLGELVLEAVDEAERQHKGVARGVAVPPIFDQRL
ncbi:hypothetical protein DV702_04770 [Sporosarcina sp. PTS2304]|uniref:hypothetical protein n=1 Tax=Sporosarcina sp. PTS2304 TaxID=2283194 RepID=UPI000E0CEFE0|nr:hypothetical protein [Sporosarcina sp. PTS2304]AXH99107.1 hypothetical protein DV702_04770 [Sporosarcina sp. PTS2304]